MTITELHTSEGLVVGPLRAFSAGDAVHSAVSCTRRTQPQMSHHRCGSTMLRGSFQSTQCGDRTRMPGGRYIEMMVGRSLFNTRGHFKAVVSDMSSSKCDKYLVTSFSFMTPVFFFFFLDTFLLCVCLSGFQLPNEIGRHKPAKKPLLME